MSNYFIGIKTQGIRELNKKILNQKVKSKTIEKTIDNIENICKDIIIIQFEDSSSIYIGDFVLYEGTKSNLKKSKLYEKTINELTKKFNKISLNDFNFIIEKSEKMK